MNLFRIQYFFGEGAKHINFMTPNFHLSRHFSTAKTQKSLISSNPDVTLELCNQILDKNPNLKTLKKLHPKIFTDKNLHSNPSLAIKLMRSYAANNDPRTTRHLFDEITDKNVVFYNVMIRSYINNHMYHDALIVFRDMSIHGFDPDNYTYPCILKACSSSGNILFGSQIHSAVIRVGFPSNLFVGNGLISMYGKCGALVEARRVLDQMPERDIVSWNSMIAGFAQSGHFDDALEVCKEMKSLKFKADAGTMASLSPAVTNTSGENVIYVNQMFTKLVKKSLVSWNVMILVYVNNSMPVEAIGLFTKMEQCGVDPDSVTLATILPACGDLTAILLGKRIHNYIERKKLRPNLLLENSLIDMYAKCGCLTEARKVFDTMKFRDVISWTSMISAYGMCGQGRDSVFLFSRMQESGLIPDSIAFVSILSACSHAGLLDEGRTYFKQMIESCNLVPRIEHFACMVDLLGRNGRLNEAYTFIREMPIEPSERVWGALLSACHVYSNMNIGIMAADHLYQLKPEQSGYYVLLSNIYAKAGKWEEVQTIRLLMKSRGIKKLPGISNVELNDRVHTFLAGDQSHPQSKKIYAELAVLIGKMREAGYVPETDTALHDVEEEDKQCHLSVHSEKLAIVFALLNTKHGTPIRITKNLRVCGDCHVASKLISKIVDREIIIRDNNRFHHFLDGVCSCRDYW